MVFCPIAGQAVVPGVEVSGKEQLVASDDEGHAPTWLCGLHAHTTGQAAAQ